MKIGQGFHIDRDDGSIDIILTEIGGSRRRRKAHLKILGVPGVTELDLRSSYGLVKVIEGVKVGIKKNYKSGPSRAELVYEGNFSARIESYDRKDY